MQFDWDPHKADLNRRDHKVDFHDAKTLFMDPLARIFVDDEHSFDERRNGIFGRSIHGEFLLVIFCERDDKIRIISARKMTPFERRRFENENG